MTCTWGVVMLVCGPGSQSGASEMRQPVVESQFTRRVILIPGTTKESEQNELQRHLVSKSRLRLSSACRGERDTKSDWTKRVCGCITKREGCES